MSIKEYVKEQKELLREQIKKANNLFSNQPNLLIIQANDDQASNAYVNGKVKDANEIGINATVVKISNEALSEAKSVTERTLIISKVIYENLHKNHGIIVQLPLPKDINFEMLKNMIPDDMDVDGFKATSHFKPCTPLGILDYLEYINFEFTGKNALVIGRSEIVGKPMAKLLLDKNMNVTIIHSKTSDFDKAKYIENADLIVVATGHMDTLTDKYTYKDTCVIVDVGINRDKNGKLIGDCARNLPVKIQTPVPGGVGLLTRLTLMKNVKLAFDKYMHRVIDNKFNI